MLVLVELVMDKLFGGVSTPSTSAFRQCSSSIEYVSDVDDFGNTVSSHSFSVHTFLLVLRV